MAASTLPRRPYSPLVEMLGLPPEGTVPYGTILLGYSAENSARIPARKPLDVTWQ